ncbi:hypothetical protein PINS_up010117 [Pythium insidiosum]|nr:hypothetical protein PINS_up010117 [Pythium insidiosum]
MLTSVVETTLPTQMADLLRYSTGVVPSSKFHGDTIDRLVDMTLRIVHDMEILRDMLKSLLAHALQTTSGLQYLPLTEGTMMRGGITPTLCARFITDVEHLGRLKQPLPQLPGVTKSLIDPSIHPVKESRPQASISKDTRTWIRKAKDGGIGKHFDQVVRLAPTNTDNISPQWLPAEFSIGDDGDTRILSYINHLHPRRCRRIYQTLECIFKTFVPMFDLVLARLSAPWPQPLLGDVESDARSWKQWIKRLDVPASPFSPSSSDFDSPFQPRNKTVRIVVEVTEITLSAEHPTLNAESQPWRYLGDQCCSIIATGMYFAAAENIDGARIVLRHDGNMPDDPELSPFYLLPYSALPFGVGEKAKELRGSVGIVQGRSLVLPNYLNLRIENLTLKEGETEGRIIALFYHLVDPTREDIQSSVTVSPKRQDWLLDATVGMLCRAKGLSNDVQRYIESYFSDVGMPDDVASASRRNLRYGHLF